MVITEGVKQGTGNGAASLLTERGRGVLRDPHLNRGTAFTREERAALGLEGLLPPGFGEDIAAKLAELSGLPVRTAPNKFAAQADVPGRVRVRDRV